MGLRWWPPGEPDEIFRDDEVGNVLDDGERADKIQFETRCDAWQRRLQAYIKVRRSLSRFEAYDAQVPEVFDVC